jgi:hypothetical protein
MLEEIRIRDTEDTIVTRLGMEIQPGLALIREHKDLLPEWALVHVRSGLTITYFHDPEKAGWAANQHLLGFDFTVSATDLVADIDAMWAIEQVRYHGAGVTVVPACDLRDI